MQVCDREAELAGGAFQLVARAIKKIKCIAERGIGRTSYAAFVITSIEAIIAIFFAFVRCAIIAALPRHEAMFDHAKV